MNKNNKTYTLRTTGADTVDNGHPVSADIVRNMVAANRQMGLPVTVGRKVITVSGFGGTVVREFTLIEK